ncbi:MAG: hypothetical protein OXL97_10940 [Chloroflexota bacterium]|nr:hypothetical protein [Chloroflexota bacterium]MDE2884984.1 hypothetical protein [Chloroflexota bacterium]
MFEGRISAALKPVVPVLIMSREGQYQPVEAVLDTGFNGDLALPPATIRRLGLTRATVFKATLANGQEVYLNGYEATALWHDRPLIATALESGNEALLGMNLLMGSKVTMEVKVDGLVAIEDAGSR